MHEKPALLQKVWQKLVWNPYKNPYNRNLGQIKRYDDWGFFSLDEDSGEKVSIDRASKLTIVSNCLNVLAQDLATFPKQVRQDNNSGKKNVKNRYWRSIAKKANGYMNAYNYWYTQTWLLGAYGNSYAYREVSNGEVNRHILHPDDVRIIFEDGELFYKYKDRILSSRDVFHYKIFSKDGIVGESMLKHNSSLMGYKLKQDKYKSKVLGQKPPGLLSFDTPLDDAQREANKNSWQSQVQGENLGGTPILTGGAKYIPLMIPPEEAQLIETGRWTDEQILGMFRIPPSMIQNHERATFSNVEQQFINYYTHALMPIIKAFEQEEDIKLFPEANYRSENPMYVKFNVSALLRADAKTRSEVLHTMRNDGVINADEWRELEDMSPIDDGTGQLYYIQGAMMRLGETNQNNTTNNILNGIKKHNGNGQTVS